MKKDAFWFPHDSNARNDPKCVKVRRVAGSAGYGLYWMVIEMMRESADYKLELDSIDDICFDLRCDKSDIQNLFDAELFEKDERLFWSESLLERMEDWEETKRKKSKAGKASGRARKLKKQAVNEQCSNSVQTSNKQKTNTSSTKTNHEMINKTDRDDKTDMKNKTESLLPAVVVTPSVSKKKPAKKTDAKSTEVWKAYSWAYRQRYKVEPVRNARTNAQSCQLVDKLGAEEAPHVAAYFVGLNNSFYVTKGHAIGILVSEAEKVRTEWATGNNVTQHSAREADRVQAVGDGWQKAIEKFGDK